MKTWLKWMKATLDMGAETLQDARAEVPTNLTELEIEKLNEHVGDLSMKIQTLLNKVRYGEDLNAEDL